MGISKSYRGAMASGAQNTPRGPTKVSSGPVVRHEGTEMSGTGGRPRKTGMRGKKSRRGSASMKGDGPYGQS